jgi:predicted enzyme related to lactoylglutathione lyase
MPNPVVHWEISSKNPKKLWKYYGDLFGWQVQDVHMPGADYALVDTKEKSGANGGIGQAQGANQVTFYVEVGDLDAMLKKAERLGGKVLQKPTVVPGMVTFATFQDPDGNIIGMVKSEAPPGGAPRR